MIDRRQPMPYHYVIEPQFFQDRDRVHRAVVTITSFEQLAPALADADHAVVIDNPKIERSLERLYAWQRTIQVVMGISVLGLLWGWIIQQALFSGYKIDISVLFDWKMHKAEGKVTLTPSWWESEVLRRRGVPSIEE